ncbi:MAG: cytidylate kinase-like family protein [Bellilinea sp.]
MDVITISRQLGSLGFQVGKEVAQRLNYQLVWRDLINQAAIRAGAPEVALAMFDEFNLLGIAPSPRQFADYIRVVGQVIKELADAGKIVIIGRAGQVLLADDPRVLHVRVVAPYQDRIERVAVSRGISVESAQAQVQASDRARKNYLRRFYQVNWEDPDLYDLVLNTGRISVATAAESICLTARVQESAIETSQSDQEEMH